MKYVIPFVLLALIACTTTPLSPGSDAPVSGIVTEISPFSQPTKGETAAVTLACSKYGWGNRGPGPRGYLAALPLLEHRMALRTDSAIGRPLGDPSRDSLAHYKAEFEKLGIPLDTPEERVRAVRLLLTGLGMRESSGNYLEGWDVDGPRTESGAEAGLFQSSFDSIKTVPELQALYDAYRAHPEFCMVDWFKPGSYQPKGRNTTPIGSGAGRAFQVFTKECPAFATEYAAVMVRVNGGKTGHYGPIRRKEAELRKECF